MKSSTRFILENARVVRINRREKVTFLTVYATAGKFDEYFDVTVFPGADLVGTNVGEGESVTVKGDLGHAKKKDGEKYAQLQIVAREILPGDESLTPALPARKEQAPKPPETDDNIPF
jgi:hypothetical protein